LVNEGTDEEQAVAICSTQWEDNKMQQLFDKSKFGSNKEMIDFLVKNKGSLIAQKKATMKRADGIIIDTFPEIKIKAFEGKSDTEDTIYRRAVINTTKVLDSHDDVHFDGLWNKSLRENKNIMHIQEHDLRFDKIIADGDQLKAYVMDITFKDLGFKFEGSTQALVFDSEIQSDRNEFMFKQYSKNRVKNHSVGMIYTKVALAVNDDDYPDEKAVWDKYFNQILVGKKRAEEQKYFWAVIEAKVIEGSAVPIGSNTLTPTLKPKAEPPQGTQYEDTEPPQGTLNYKRIANKLLN